MTSARYRKKQLVIEGKVNYYPSLPASYQEISYAFAPLELVGKLVSRHDHHLYRLKRESMNYYDDHKNAQEYISMAEGYDGSKLIEVL